MRETVKVKGWIKKETASAILIKQGDLSMWVPSSQVDHISRKAPMQDGSCKAEITMPKWLAKDRGFDFE